MERMDRLKNTEMISFHVISLNKSLLANLVYPGKAPVYPHQPKVSPGTHPTFKKTILRHSYKTSYPSLSIVRVDPLDPLHICLARTEDLGYRAHFRPNMTTGIFPAQHRTLRCIVVITCRIRQSDRRVSHDGIVVIVAASIDLETFRGPTSVHVRAGELVLHHPTMVVAEVVLGSSSCVVLVRRCKRRLSVWKGKRTIVSLECSERTREVCHQFTAVENVGIAVYSLMFMDHAWIIRVSYHGRSH